MERASFVSMQRNAIFTINTTKSNTISGIFYSKMGIIRRIVAEGLGPGGKERGIERPG
jgi:hypothetical protein